MIKVACVCVCFLFTALKSICTDLRITSCFEKRCTSSLVLYTFDHFSSFRALAGGIVDMLAMQAEHWDGSARLHGAQALEIETCEG